MKDIWFSRDFPVLDCIVEYFELNDRTLLKLSTVAELSGFTIQEVGKAAQNLEGAGYLELMKAMSGSDFTPWRVKAVFPSALKATGAWSTPKSLSEAIITEMTRLSDLTEPEESRSWFRKVLSGAGDISKDVLITFVTEAATNVFSPNR